MDNQSLAHSRYNLYVPYKIREFEYGDVYRKKYREKSSVLLWTGVFQ